MASISPNQKKAVRIAQEITADIDVDDLQYIVSEEMDLKDHNRLYNAVDDSYSENEAELVRLDKIIDDELKSDEAREAAGQKSDIDCDQLAIRQIAWFYLGFAAARRLLQPPLMVVNGSPDRSAEPVEQ